MWNLISRFEQATGMRVNTKKTEGLRMGALLHTTPPLIPGVTDMINWVKPGSYLRLLGIPFWEPGKYDPNLFMQALYDKYKCKIANWTDHDLISVIGRAMLVNSMIYSRFRYVAQCMPLPDWLNEAIEADAQALIWAREARFAADEVGSTTNFRRFMRKEAQYNPKPFGINLLPWTPHQKALQVRWLLRYRDATRGEWKKVLDTWLAGGSEGRGSVFTTLPPEFLFNKRPNRTRQPALPQFWTQAVHNLRLLTLTQINEGLYSSKEDARSQPLFNNPTFTISNLNFHDTWRRELDTNTVGDTYLSTEGRFFRTTT
jgi:hypothetical protein